jgi:hypothetical protein
LNTLRILQALEYFGRVTGRVMAVVPGPQLVPALIEEFRFAHVTAGGDAHDHRVEVSELLDHCSDGPQFLKSSVQYLTAKLSEPATSLATYPLPSAFHVDRHSHLGDLLCVVWGLEDYLRLNQIADTVTVSGPPAIDDIIAIMQCRHLQYVGKESGPAQSTDDLFSLCSWRMPWMLRFSAVLAATFGGCAGAVACPELTVARGHPRTSGAVVGCQFDTRAGDRNLVKIAPTILQKLAKGRKVVAIGGPDTTDYLGAQVDYCRAGILGICEQLSALELFVGCDSGVAHLAGLLRMPSVVFNFTDLEPVLSFFSGYPSVVVVDRRFVDIW